MFLLGLTGGIASGKSTVSAELVELGAKIIDADGIARAIVLPGQAAWQAIVERFGTEILLPDQRLDRMKLGEKIFRDSAARSDLDQLMHPFIEQEILRQIECCRVAKEYIVVLDVPLLYEVGWNRRTDANWVIYVTPQIQIKRLMERNHFSHAQAADRIASQMPLEEKIKFADVIIDNNSDLVYTKRQVKENWNTLIKNRND